MRGVVVEGGSRVKLWGRVDPLLLQGARWMGVALTPNVALTPKMAARKAAKVAGCKTAKMVLLGEVSGSRGWKCRFKGRRCGRKCHRLPLPSPSRLPRSTPASSPGLRVTLVRSKEICCSPNRTASRSRASSASLTPKVAARKVARLAAKVAGSKTATLRPNP